jgi:hypothetical protein
MWTSKERAYGISVSVAGVARQGNCNVENAFMSRAHAFYARRDSAPVPAEMKSLDLPHHARLA